MAYFLPSKCISSRLGRGSHVKQCWVKVARGPSEGSMGLLAVLARTVSETFVPFVLKVLLKVLGSLTS